MKPLKFDPIEVCAGLTLCAPFSYPGLPPSLVMLETKNFGIKLTDASTTAALIAALQVAHKAQLEAETLTFADLKPGDWFRWAGAGHSSGYGLRKIDECTC